MGDFTCRFCCAVLPGEYSAVLAVIVCRKNIPAAAAAFPSGRISPLPG